jgi:tRNA1Val (adenine37-N6)-methyltransferase
VVLWQPARGCGYRVNLDPVLLASFVSPARHVVDLGAGVGVIGILLLASGKAERVTAVELQPELAALARENARENGLADRLEILEGDLRSLELPAADAAVFNPPYFLPSEGRGAPHAGVDVARREHHGTLADFVACATACVRAEKVPGTPSRVSAIIPARRSDELERLLAEAGAGRVRRRAVVPRPGKAPTAMLVEATLGGGPCATITEPPLVVHGNGDERFGAEVRAMLRED